jgi:long-subunit fatty acid transport protein
MRLSWVLALVLIIPLVTTSGPSFAAGGGGAAYLQLMVGARPMGMGGAFTGLADDVTAVFFNPAGISALAQREAMAMHGALSFDRNFNYLAAAVPRIRGESGWSLSYTRFSIDGIPETRVATNGTPLLNGDGTVTIFSLFDDVEENFTLGYAWKLKDGLRIGINYRLLHQEMFRKEANGQGVDVGLLYQATPDVRLGLTLRNMFEGVRWNETGHRDDVPFIITAGAAVRGWKDIIYLVDVFEMEREGLGYRLGLEKWWAGHYALRAGVNDGDFTVGASAKYQSFQFDYAFQEQTLGDINRLSLTYRW